MKGLKGVKGDVHCDIVIYHVFILRCHLVVWMTGMSQESQCAVASDDHLSEAKRC